MDWSIMVPDMSKGSNRLWLRQLSPAYFGVVMATGILSLAAHGEGLDWLATALYGINLGFYLLLWGLYLWRTILAPEAVKADLRDHLRSPGYFTLVAGSGVLGAQALLVGGHRSLAVLLWGVTLSLWLLLTWLVFVLLSTRERKPSLELGINGGWLLAVVATQSVSVLSALLAPSAGMVELELNFLALSTWLWGGMLYIWIMALIFYRYLFLSFSPEDLSPPYWINMGAMAISTLAGSLLISNAPTAPLLDDLLPFLKGFTVLYWATGTWWIPMLLMLGIWRHLIRRVKLRYDPLYWGLVFPLGMYAMATREMGQELELPFLALIPQLFLGLALCAWLLTTAGAVRGLLARPGKDQPGKA